MAQSIPPDALIAGRYALYGEIASGGMATVHIGRLVGTAGFSRTVAIKRLQPQFARDPEFVAMFVDEARLAARIRHPNVVPTLDVVATDGQLLLVMEYVQGESLARLIRDMRMQATKMPIRVASSIMAGVLHGLHAAHEAKNEHGEPLGIVHRDVSPQNVLVGTDGVSRVLDFGVAKAAGRAHATREGRLKGKFAYMAPEQVSGSPADRLCDIYAAAVVLWEALTTDRLFDAESETVLLARVLHGTTTPPSAKVPGLPAALDTITMRGLSRDPADRYPTAREMAHALEEAVPPATASEVGAWVEKTAANALGKRARGVAAIESASSLTSPDARELLWQISDGQPPDSADTTTQPNALQVQWRPPSFGPPPAAPSPARGSVPPPGPGPSQPPPASGPRGRQSVPAPPPAVPGGGMASLFPSNPITTPGREGPPPRRTVWMAQGVGAGVLAALIVALWFARPFFRRNSEGESAPGTPPASSGGPADSSSALGGAPAVVAPVSGGAKSACPAGMVRIPGGKFFMGADDELPLEKPAHKVNVSPYCIDAYEVTTEQYKACSDEGECKRAGQTNEWDGITPRDRKVFDALCNIRDPIARAKHPINCVDWEMAKIYCRAHDARLPTEAEWEFAARGPDGRKYPWGDDAPSAAFLNACGEECVTWGQKSGVEETAMYHSDDGFATTAPVGSFPEGKSRYGVYDVVGNVWEWVGDWYAPYTAKEQVDPRGAPDGQSRVIRGGAWNGAYPAWVRPTFRYHDVPDKRSYGTGFRCAKSL